MRKILFLLVVGLLVGGMAVWTVPASADQGNTVFEEGHRGAINIGDDYTITLPEEGPRFGGYAVTGAYSGQFAQQNTFITGPDQDNTGSAPYANGDALIPYLQGGATNPSGANWYWPCPPSGTVGGANEATFYQAGCDALTDPEDPQTENAMGLGTGSSGNRAFSQLLYDEVIENWVDNSVLNKDQFRTGSGTGLTVFPDPNPFPVGVLSDSGGKTWAGTLDQDLASLFIRGNATAGGANVGGLAARTYSIDQDLDQGIAYIEGTTFPGAITDTDMRTKFGDAQRIVQEFAWSRTGNPYPVTEGVASQVHQWVADWMRDTYRGASLSGENDATGTVTWTLETLMSSSFSDGPGGALGTGGIHQVNEQISTLTEVWTDGNGPYALGGRGNDRISQTMLIEFWAGQTTIIPYNLGTNQFTPAKEDVNDVNHTIIGGDHNPLNN